MNFSRCSAAPFMIAAVGLILFGFGVLSYSRRFVDEKIRDEVKVMHQQGPVAKAKSRQLDEVNPVPTDKQLDGMSLAEISDFFHGYMPSTQVLCNRVVRMGKLGDGGWDICDDPRYRVDPKNCIVYSFGIANDFSYDDAMETHGCEVHSYDPSMNVKDHLRGKKVHFHKVGISKTNGKRGSWELYTFGKLREMNGHQPQKRQVDVVKMDVESSDLAALQGAIEEGSLRDVRQLSFETHIYQSNGDPVIQKMKAFTRVFRQLWDLGFRIYFTNRNDNPVNVYKSKLHGVFRTMCHEISMVNINLRR